MHFISEEPWPLVALLGVVAAGFLIALRVTQQGKYLVGAGIALTMAVLLLAVERAWVTDDERIEASVYELARAVRASDAEGVLRQMAPEVEVGQGDEVLGELDPDLVRRELAHAQFQIVAISQLDARAGRESRLGKATFRALVHGEYTSGTYRQPFASPTTWDLGFRETAPGTWKVTRITPTSLPPAASSVLRGAMRLRRAFGR